MTNHSVVQLALVMMILKAILTLILINLSRAHIYVDEKDIPELAYLDKTVDPCENFYQYTCGNFKNIRPLPKKQLNIDHFTILQDEIHGISRNILESSVKDEDPVGLQKAKTFYNSCNDEFNLDGMTPPSLAVLDYFGEWPVIDRKDNVGKKMTWAEIGDVIADYGLPFFFDFTVTSSYTNSTSNVIYLNKDPLINPDAGIIGNIPDDFDFLSQGRTKRDTSTPIPYHVFLRSMAFKLRDRRRTGKPNAAIEKEIEQTIMYLRYISGGGIIPVNINITTLRSESTIRELQEWTDKFFGEDVGMNWLDFLGHVFKNTGIVIKEDMKIRQDSIQKIYGILNLYKMSDSDTIKNYIIARLLTYMASDSEGFMRESLKTFYKALNYDVYERPEYCLRKTLGYRGNIGFSNAIVYEYQRYHFNIKKLDKAAQMVSDLRDSFLEVLDGSTWMDNSSRQSAKLKALNIITLLGFDEAFAKKEEVDKFYENLRVCSWDHFGNSQRLRAFNKAFNMKAIGSPKNRELWSISALEVNAFYNRANNRILFPISILNPTFFNGNISVLDYSRIGSIIGHEITHGFDNIGRNYSPQGSLTNWWSKETEIAFGEKIGCFEKQYGGYYIDEIKKYVNGFKTLNENLADNGGLHSAYKAARKLGERMDNVHVNGYTPEQLFFIGYGTMWCMTETEYYLEKMYETQPYSPGRYRVIGAVSNMEEFSSAFNCQKNSKMNPEEKCVLW